MSSGRQDYQAGVVPIKSVYGSLQTPIFLTENYSIPDGDQYVYIYYTVPAGYRFNVCGYRIEANQAYPNQYILSVEGEDTFFGFVDGMLRDNLPDNAPIQVNEGERIWINVSNDDDQYITYRVTIFGYLEQIIA